VSYVLSDCLQLLHLHNVHMRNCICLIVFGVLSVSDDIL